VHPVIRDELEDNAAVVGANVSFTCTAMGNPTPMIINWRSNNSDNIDSSDEVMIGSITSSITLYNVSLSDLNQWYTCTAINEFGASASSSTFLSEAGMCACACACVCVCVCVESG